MRKKNLEAITAVLLAVMGMFFLANCINQPEGYEFKMQNPDGLNKETDSIEVYVVIGEGDDTASTLLYSGNKDDDGFEGPYTGVVKNYNGGEFRLRIIQYNDDKKVIKDESIAYKNVDGEADELSHDTLRDISKDTEILLSLAILTDSSRDSGTLLKYSYDDGRLGKIQIWNGDISDVSKKDASSTITYNYSQSRKSVVSTVSNNGEKSDSLFSYKNGKPSKLEINGRGDDYYFKFTYENEKLAATGRYVGDELNRLIKHSYNSDGDIAADSIYIAEDKDKTLKGGVDYAYKKGLLASILKWDIRAKKKQERESIDYIYNDDGKLERTETYLEGGKRLLTVSTTYRLSDLGNPLSAVKIDEEEQTLLKYYKYTYERKEYKKELAKIGASAADAFAGLISRMAGWELDGAVEEQTW